MEPRTPTLKKTKSLMPSSLSKNRSPDEDGSPAPTRNNLSLIKQGSVRSAAVNGGDMTWNKLKRQATMSRNSPPQLSHQESKMKIIKKGALSDISSEGNLKDQDNVEQRRAQHQVEVEQRKAMREPKKEPAELSEIESLKNFSKKERRLI